MNLDAEVGGGGSSSSSGGGEAGLPQIERGGSGGGGSGLMSYLSGSSRRRASAEATAPAAAEEASGSGGTGGGDGDQAALGLDFSELESIFGLTPPPGDSPAADGEGGAPACGPARLRRAYSTSDRNGITELSGSAPASVRLLPSKRASNVEIALSRLRLTNEQIRHALEHPTAPDGSLVPHLSAENVAALLTILPTAEEAELVREAAKDADPSTFGRIERLFLAFGQVGEVEARLRSIQVTQHFDERRERLANHTKTLRDACEQVRASPKLRTLLKLILTIGNYLNGASARGGAYGFRLADLEKLRHVRSTNLNTTLLHYLAKLPQVGSTVWIKELKEVELPSVFAAKTLVVSEMRPELTSLREQLSLVEKFGVALKAKAAAKANLAAVGATDDDDASSDPLGLLLEQFMSEKRPVFEALAADLSAMECEIKSLASFLAEPASSGAEALFVPIATFVTSLEQVHSDNLLEAAKERRKQESERRRTLAASASSANLRNGSQTDRPMLRRGATMSTMELGSDGRRRPNSARGVADDPAGGVIDDLRRELERRVSSRRSMSTATANGGESPPDSPFLSPAVPYGRNYNDDLAKQRGGAAPAPAPPPHVFEIPKLRPVRRTQATLEREASASSDADQTASGPGPLQMDTTAEAPSLPPPLPPPLLPHVLGGGGADSPILTPPPLPGVQQVEVAWPEDDTPGGSEALAEPHSVGGLHAAAARQLRWLASAEEEAMERETLSEEQSPQKRSSSMATGSAGSSSNGSSLSGSCNGINGSGSSGGGSPKGGGGGGGGVGGIIRQGVAFVRQHSFERKKEKMKAKAAAAAAAATQAQSAAATAYPSMDMKAWEAKRVSGAANGMPAPTPPTPAAGFDRGAVGAGELNGGARNSHEGTTLPPPPPPPPGRGSSGQRQSLEF